MNAIKKFIITMLYLTTFTFSLVAVGSHGIGMGGGSFGGFSHPPGLNSKPYGLMKQGKTPYGWSKGNKVGWKCSGAANHRNCVRLYHNHTIND